MTTKLQESCAEGALPLTRAFGPLTPVKRG